MLDELVRFAKLHYESFAAFEDWQVKRFFEVLKETTIVAEQGGKIQGFAVYVERPEGLYFIAIAGIEDVKTNLKNMLKGRHELPDKPILWHDEKRRLHKWLKQ